MKIEKVTALLVVDRIEPCLPLWKGLGFAVTVEVPHRDALGFVILARGGLEVMLQTRASLEEDAPRVAARSPSSLLYCDVDSLAKARSAVRAAAGTEVLISERKTTYGARELWMVDAAGQVIGFAEHA